VIGMPYGGHHSLLKPSIIPTATYGPWAIINGDVHDYSEHGSGPWAAPGYNSGGSGSGSGSGHSSGSGSGSRSSSRYSESASKSTSGSSPRSSGYNGFHGSNSTSPSSASSASYSSAGYTRPSSTGMYRPRKQAPSANTQ
jgi:hypothetical protein